MTTEPRRRLLQRPFFTALRSTLDDRELLRSLVINVIAGIIATVIVRWVDRRRETRGTK